ncbi:MAG: DUF3293 domain-containing protein, partial [Candidatus Saccharimonadales bacterium]
MPNLFLHGERRDDGKWSMPGGHAIGTETAIETAARELKEETGMTVTDMQLVRTGETQMPEGPVQISLFMAPAPDNLNMNVSGDPDSEFKRFKFLDPTNHPDMLLEPQDDILVQYLRDQQAQAEQQPGLAKADFPFKVKHQKYKNYFRDRLFPIAGQAANEHKFQNLQELRDVLGQGNFAILSANRSTMSEGENKKAHQKLRQELMRLPNKFTTLTGNWGGDIEPSFMVHGLPRAKAIELAHKYGQTSHIQSEKGNHQEISHDPNYVPRGGGSGHVMAADIPDNYSEMELGDKTKARFQLNLLGGFKKSESLDKGRDLGSKVGDALEALSTGKPTNKKGARMRPGMLLFTTGDKPLKAAPGSKPNTMYSFGPHWPMVRLSEDGRSAYLNIHGYGGATGDMVDKVRATIGTVMPSRRIIEIDHPNYLEAAKVMRGNESDLHRHLKEAAEKHPDQAYRQHAREALQFINGLGKAEDKRRAAIGWNAEVNHQILLGRLSRALSTIGLTLAPPSGGKSMGGAGPTSVTYTPDEGPAAQQIVHEAAHAAMTPVGSSLTEYQNKLGLPGEHRGRANPAPYAEPGAQGAEAMISRMAGIPPFRVPQGAKPGTKIKAAQEAAKQNVRDRQEGITRFNPKTGVTEEGTGTHALINLRAKGTEGISEAQRRLAARAGIRKDEDQPETLVHYGKVAGLDSIDPFHMGTGAPAAEYRRGKPEIARSYFYRETGGNHEAEPLVTQGAVSRYRIKLHPSDKLYDLGSDPEGLVQSAVKENQGAWNSDRIWGKIKESGYHGLYNSGSALPNVVALFYPKKVESEEPVQTAKSEFLAKAGKEIVYVALDGDNIGASVERAALTNDLGTIRRQDKIIRSGQRLIRRWAKRYGAMIYIDGGDDLSFILVKKYAKFLPVLREAYHKLTGYTITVGTGCTMSQAAEAMVFGKLHGKDQIREYEPHMSQHVKDNKVQGEDKYREEGLLGKTEDLDKMDYEGEGYTFRVNSQVNPNNHVLSAYDKNGFQVAHIHYGKTGVEGKHQVTQVSINRKKQGTGLYREMVERANEHIKGMGGKEVVGMKGVAHPHNYDWHEGHTAHYTGIKKADMPKIEQPPVGNDQAAGAGATTYPDVAKHYGTVL